MDTKNKKSNGQFAWSIFFQYSAATMAALGIAAIIFLQLRQQNQISSTMLFLLFYAAIIIAAGVIVTIITFRLKKSKHLLQIKERYFRTIIDNSNDPMALIDSGGHISFINNALETLIGKKNAEDISPESLLAAIHPEDQAPMLKALAEADATASAVARAEIRVKGPENDWRWIDAVIKNLYDEPAVGSLIANYHDITERKKNIEQIKKSKRQLEIILNGVADGVLAQDAEGVYIYANANAIKTLGVASFDELLKIKPADLLQKFEIFDEFNKPFNPDLLPNRLALEGKEVRAVPVRFCYKNDNSEKWAVVRSSPILDERGNVTMAVTIFKDITQNKIREERLLRSENYYRFLAQAGELLSSSLDYKTTLSRMARHAVPKIADYCAVDIVDTEATTKRLTVEHIDPEKIKLAFELSEKYPSEESAINQVIQTGKTFFMDDISSALLKQNAKDEHHHELMEKIGFRSLIIVPLAYQDKVYGALTLVASSRKYSNGDVVLAEELGRRAGLAIENSRLYISAENIIRREHEHLALIDTLLSNAPLGFAFFNEKLEILRVNDSLASMLKVTGQEEYLGKQLSLLSPALAEQIEPVLLDVISQNKPIVNLEFNSQSLGLLGPKRYWLKSFYPVHSPQDKKLLGVGVMINEITERKFNEESMRFQALHDPLTNLPNRKYFQEHLEYIIAGQKQDPLLEAPYAVLFLDIDRFKNINDSLGHEIGDTILKKIAFRLKRVLADSDFIARWGGDEFIILLGNLPVSRSALNRDVMNAAKKILKCVRELIMVENYELQLGGSIGISMYPQDGKNVQELLKNADIAMYRAKEGGRNQYQMFTRTMNVKAGQRLTLENDLRNAVRQKELAVRYQPVMELESGNIIGVEALMRWNHPKLGTLSPKDFISIAEETGSIVQIGKWIIRQACKQAQSWNSELPFSPKVTVNLSARQFSQPNLVNSIKDALHETGLDASSLELEITESVAMENFERTQAKLAELKKMGVKIIIDDFGTGYSSLSYLKRFPLHKLKIDQSFIKNCIANEQDAAIIKAIISMAHSLKLSVIAEGVETQEQLAFLAKYKCDCIQGYLLSKPIEADALATWLKQHYAEKSGNLKIYADAFTKNVK